MVVIETAAAAVHVRVEERVREWRGCAQARLKTLSPWSRCVGTASHDLLSAATLGLVLVPSQLAGSNEPAVNAEAYGAGC